MSAYGRVELIVGPMFAGKTTELMRRVRREMHARRSCFIIKYANDVRYDQDNVASHDKITLRACAAVRVLGEVGSEWRHYDVIAIDEGQFFDDLVTFCRDAADAGKTVMVSALDGDYLCRPFGRICELVPHCETVTKLTAVCMMCHAREASFTRRTVDSDERELIGGAEMYIATCRACYNAPGPLSSAVVRHVHETMRQVERVCLAPYLHASASSPHEAKNNDNDDDDDDGGEKDGSATQTQQQQQQQQPPYTQTQTHDVHLSCESVDTDDCKTPCAGDADRASSPCDSDAEMSTTTTTTTTATTSPASSDTSSSSAAAAATSSSAATAASATPSAAATSSSSSSSSTTLGKKRAREQQRHDDKDTTTTTTSSASTTAVQAQRVLTHADY